MSATEPRTTSRRRTTTMRLGLAGAGLAVALTVGGIEAASSSSTTSVSSTTSSTSNSDNSDTGTSSGLVTSGNGAAQAGSSGS